MQLAFAAAPRGRTKDGEGGWGAASLEIALVMFPDAGASRCALETIDENHVVERCWPGSIWPMESLIRGRLFGRAETKREGQMDVDGAKKSGCSRRRSNLRGDSSRPRPAQWKSGGWPGFVTRELGLEAEDALCAQRVPVGLPQWRNPPMTSIDRL